MTCRYRSPFAASTYRCRRRGVLGGLCVEHRLDTLRWEWKGRRWAFTVDLSNLNRPHVYRDEDHERPRWWSFDYGNGNGDPVLSLFLTRDPMEKN